MPKEYYEECPELKVNGKTYNVSLLYTPVEGFDVFSEFDMYTQNDGGGVLKRGIMGWFKFFPVWEEDEMQDYGFRLYKKNYLEWSTKCSYTKGRSHKSSSTTERSAGASTPAAPAKASE